MMRCALSLLLLASCATAPLAPGPLSPAWQPARRDGGSVAFHHPSGGTIAAAASCDPEDDLPRHVLMNHLLIGIEQRRESGREITRVAGRDALRTRLRGVLDGVEVAMDLVVLRKGGCTYDLVLVAAPAALERRRPDFDRFLAGFVAGER
jgi:hypothetical protein